MSHWIRRSVLYNQDVYEYMSYKQNQTPFRITHHFQDVVDMVHGRHYSDTWAGCMVLLTHCNFDSGQTRAMIFPFTSPNGTGP